MFRNTGANGFAKIQMRLAYEDKRDLYCRCLKMSNGEISLAATDRKMTFPAIIFKTSNTGCVWSFQRIPIVHIESVMYISYYRQYAAYCMPLILCCWKILPNT